jgi:hypothetical protein
VLDSAVVGHGSYLRSDKIGQDYFDQLSSVSLFVNALGGVQAWLGEWRSIEQFSFGSTTSNAPVCEIAWQRRASRCPRTAFSDIGEIETSITAHLAAEPEGTDRDTDDALADLWSLSHENDPPVGLLRGRIKALPRRAVDYIDRRFPMVFEGPFLTRAPATRFQEWAATADAQSLIRAIRVLRARPGS